MAAQCKTCSEEIMSSDFIKCYGTCASVFHSKCVSIGKTLLNALGSNPNIRWFCHDCHVNDSNIASSMNEIKGSIEQISSSLASDLAKFVNSMSVMTKCVTDSFKSMSNSNMNDMYMGNSSKRRRDEPQASNPGKFRRIVSQSSMESSSQQRVLTHQGVNSDFSQRNESSEKRKSIVVSNIAPGITTDELAEFVASKLKIGKENIRVTTLMPRSVKIDEARFLQFRISVPDTAYNSIKSHTLWPSGVRIRDFVFKRSNSSQLTTSHPVDKSQFVSASKEPVEPVLQFPDQPNVELLDQVDVLPNINPDFTLLPTNAAVMLQDIDIDIDTDQGNLINC